MGEQRTVGYDGMWVPPEQDPRTQESADGELANYRAYLDNYRATLEMKCADLTPEQLATRSVPPSDLSLLGLVRHMAQVEHGWFARFFQRRLDEPRPFWGTDDHEVVFSGAVGTQECVEEAFAAWKEQVADADAWLDTQSDETLGRGYPHPHGGDEEYSARDVLVHMVEEYARHCGHADLLRECIDGRTGQ
ncbi:MAG: DinB family protein [Nocardioides sp.]|nr:DinB family protein [Nocardioides sp.]